MQPEARDAVCLWDMLEAARSVARFTEGLTLADFLEVGSILVRRGVERELEILGEAARRVSPAFREAHPDLPWRDIVGLRNVISHGYDRVDHEEVHAIAQNRIPVLIAQLVALVPPTPEASE